MAQAIRSDALYLSMQAQMIQENFAPLFAQDPPPHLPTIDIPAVPPVILLIDLKEDGVVPVFIEDKVVEDEDGFEIDDLAGPKILPTTLPVVPPEPVIEIADLKDAPPLISDDGGGYDTKPCHIRTFNHDHP